MGLNNLAILLQFDNGELHKMVMTSNIIKQMQENMFKFAVNI